MGIKTSEISSLIKEQIKNFNNEIKYTNDVGTVVTIGDGVALIYGLEKAMLGELLLFSNNTYGMVMNLEEDAVGAVLLGSDEGVKEGDEVKRTKRVVEVPVGDALLGRVVNALGQPIDGLGEIKTEEKAPVEKVAPSIMARQSVNSPLETGIIAIDAMIPIGKGQRELIIGDRQTGKTSIAIDTIINQVGKNVKCVYVAIGQKNSSVAAISKRLKDHNALSYSVIVNANASELAPLQYIAPYAGMTIAEYWCAKGEDVLIIFDDLSKHAVAYRTLSLLLKRSPGREAYPGDIFYLHSRLLERASKLNPAHGGGTITALPIVETLAGDISAYIPTNVISITDGQIFLQTDLFNAGQRPAIDSGLSVSRVGSAAQFNVIKKVAKSLKINLANFRELQSFSQFGSDLDETTRKTIKHGNILMEILKQNQFALKTLDRQVIELFTAKYGFLDELEIDEVKGYLDDLYDYLNKFHKTVLTKINTTKNIFKGERDALKVIITSFNKERKY